MVGLGATGLSLVRVLTARGARVNIVDGKSEPSGLSQLRDEFPEAQFRSTDFSKDMLPESDFIALSPGVPRASFAVAQAICAGVPVFGDVELFAREVPDRSSIFAVTGSNGKTTTTALAAELAVCTRPDARAAGNIGIPILDAFAEAPTCSTWILELSSFQLESTQSLKLVSATVLNVTDNHLDRYPSFFAYAATKERIFTHASSQVLNRADPWSMSMRQPARDCVTFGTDEATSGLDYGVATLHAESFLMNAEAPILAVKELGVSGAHNAQNALAALALVRSMKTPHAAQTRVLRHFAGMPHRCQLVGVIDGISIVDDSKATTVVATNAALEGLAAPTWLIAGGDGKGQHFSTLGVAAAKYCRAVHLIGRDATSIAAVLAASGVPHRIFSNLEDATHAALELAEPGDQILLSPACASWDMFRNYTHRAEVFVRSTSEWAQRHGRDLVARGVPA